MAESFCRFFELKSFLFEFYFFELYLFESSISSMMINTIPPGSRGSLAASRPAAVAGRDLAILPRLPGEIVYIFLNATKFCMRIKIYEIMCTIFLQLQYNLKLWTKHVHSVFSQHWTACLISWTASACHVWAIWITRKFVWPCIKTKETYPGVRFAKGIT